MASGENVFAVVPCVIYELEFRPQTEREEYGTDVFHAKVAVVGNFLGDVLFC